MRRSFTLIELLLVIGIIGIIAALVVLAINPQQQLLAANDVKRSSAVREIQNATMQYEIDYGILPAANIPVGTADSALPICRDGISLPTCIDLANIAPTYLS